MRKWTSIGPVSLAILPVFAVACAVLLRFVVFGPFKLILPVNSPVNAECVIAVSFLLVTLTRSIERTLIPVPDSSNRSLRAFLVVTGSIVLLMLAAYSRALAKPFLFDDYGHVTMVSHATLHGILSKFYLPQPDIFFRPLGFLFYYLDFQWAGFNPFLWHTWSLLIHIANCLLVYVLLRQVGFKPLSSALLELSLAFTELELKRWLGQTRGSTCSLPSTLFWHSYLSKVCCGSKTNLLRSRSPLHGTGNSLERICILHPIDNCCSRYIAQKLRTQTLV